MMYMTTALEPKKYAIVTVDPTAIKYFAGYDFMGSVNWVNDLKDALGMDPEEADQIVADLKAAE